MLVATGAHGLPPEGETATIRLIASD